MPDDLAATAARFGAWAEQEPIAVLVVALLAFAVLARVVAGRRRGRPRAGEIWFAQVPFEDGTGSKDRPVLLLSVTGRSCTVARLTSQDQAGRRDYLLVPDGVPGLRRRSWVSVHPVRLRRSALRRRTGDPGDALVEWFRDTTGGAAA